MTSTISKKIRNGVLLAILGLGLFAIVITGFGTGGMGGIGGAGGGQQAETIAEINGVALTDQELQRRLSTAFLQYQAENRGADRGRFYDEVFDPGLEELINNRAVAAYARQLGFVAPASLIDDTIRRDIGDDARFRALLEQLRMSERDFRADIEEQLLIQMVAAPVGGRGRIAPTMSRAFADLLLESRTGQFGAVPTELLTGSIQPSDQEVARFYEGNRQLFQQPERRIIRFAIIGREQLGDAARVSDAEIATYFQQNQARFGPSEARSVQIFKSADEAVARRFAERVRGGTSFVDAARAEGFQPEDVTFANQNREQVARETSADVANAVFAAAQNDLVGATAVPGGFRVVRVEAISRTPGRSLDAVRGEVVTALEQEKIADALATRDEELRERLRDGASLEELAREGGLQIQTTPAVTAAGTAPNFQIPPEFAPVASAGFDLDANEPDLQEVEADKRIAIVEVTSILPPAVPPLDQIQGLVRQRLIERTAAERGRAIAEGIVNRINGGMAPDQAYAQAGIPIPPRETRTERRSTIERQGQQAAPPFRILFAIPEGRARMVAAPNNQGWIIVHHQRRTAGNAATDSEGREALAEAERRLTSTGPLELAGQFARAVRTIITVERDDERIAALRRRLITGQ